MKAWIQKIRSNPKEIWNSTKTILLAILVALIFRYSVAAPYKIPTGSMIPTLKIGDFIFVSKLAYGLKLPFTNYNLVNFSSPKRGDVVVFIYPEDRKLDFIKRVVGLPGDEIEVKEDVLFVNHQPMPRTSLPDREIIADLGEDQFRSFAQLYTEQTGEKKHVVMEVSPYPNTEGPWKVPFGHLFVMGDNRDNSRDSRVWGFVKEQEVRGRAIFIWLSLDRENPLFSIGPVSMPRIRWNRFGMKII